MNRFFSVALLITVLAPLLLSVGCAPTSANDLKMGPMNMLPAKMQSAPARVREAYQFAIANADALKNVPCYCGCGAMDHTSNYSCYVKTSKGDGTTVFDDHALGCSLCVDITQDVMRLSRDGKSPPDIRAFVVSAYSQFGPANQ
ncbi:MAG TPA: PCYCGC motif-containing (lipo)protein [Anaerolineae bacterium]